MMQSSGDFIVLFSLELELNFPLFFFSDESPEWSEESIKLCLYLYLGLLPVGHSLIHE